MSIRFATCNAKKELGAAAAHRTIAAVAAVADVVVWQEIESPGHRVAIKSLDDDWTTWWPGGAANACPISYRHSVFPKVRRQGRSVLTVDGEEGVTPNRYMNDIVLADRAGKNWPILNTHMISKAWTDNPERRPRWNIQARRLARRTRNLSLRWGRALGGADANRNRWKPSGSVGHWADHGTYGSAFYDVIWSRGKVKVAKPVRIPTPSDHDALVAVAS